MRSLLPVSGVVLLFAALAFPSAFIRADQRPGLEASAGALRYRSPDGALVELPNRDSGQTNRLRSLALPISLVDLQRIPMATAPDPAPAAADDDQDGLDNEYERAFETDPKRRDTDRDGFDDRTELLNGYHPLKKAVRLPFDRAAYDRYKGRFVWERLRRQLWYVSAERPARFFVTTRQPVAWDYLFAIAPAVSAPEVTPAGSEAGDGLPITPPASSSLPGPASTTLPAPALPGPDCLPERCTQLDWQTRAQLLPIPDYRRAVLPDGRLSLKSSVFEVVMPDDAPHAEAYGRIHLYQLILAYRNMERLLGRPPFALPNVIKEEFVLNHWASGSCCGSEAEGYPSVWNLGTREDYLRKIALEDGNTEYYKRTAWDGVIGNHELTHRFLYRLDVSSFLNEGLANYVQDYGAQQPIACGQGGFRFSDGTFRPYALYSCGGSHVSDIYNAGDCFWQRIEERYGLETFRRIIARFYDKPARERALSYYPVPGGPLRARATSWVGQVLLDLEQAVVPEVGERFWADFADFGISPTMAQGKTFDQERALCQQSQ